MAQEKRIQEIIWMSVQTSKLYTCHREMAIECISGSDGKEGIAKASSLLCSTYSNGDTDTNGNDKSESVFTEADMAGALKSLQNVVYNSREERKLDSSMTGSQNVMHKLLDILGKFNLSMPYSGLRCSRTRELDEFCRGDTNSTTKAATDEQVTGFLYIHQGKHASATKHGAKISRDMKYSKGQLHCIMNLNAVDHRPPYGISSWWYRYRPNPNRAHALQNAASSAAATVSSLRPSCTGAVPVASLYA